MSTICKSVSTINKNNNKWKTFSIPFFVKKHPTNVFYVLQRKSYKDIQTRVYGKQTNLTKVKVRKTEWQRRRSGLQSLNVNVTFLLYTETHKVLDSTILCTTSPSPLQGNFITRILYMLQKMAFHLTLGM